MQLPAHTSPSLRSRAGVSDGFSPLPMRAFSLIDTELDRVRQLINEQLTSSSESISRLLGYVNTHSGKMLRPGLVLLSGKAVGKITDNHIRIAAIIEMIHNATLLHDDVIDEGQKRRRAPTINSLWGNESAVLLGDFLLSKVFEMCADLQPKIIRIIAATTTRICKGELTQTIQRQNWQLSEPEYIDIITEKSAALFSSACLLGALLAGANQTRLQLLGGFGLNVGIAFQITDDLLDIIGDESKTGKTLGRDIDKNKLTLALIHWSGTVDEGHRKPCVSRIASSDRRTLVEMLAHSGSLEYANNRVQEFVTKAIAFLAGLKASAAKNALIETAEFIGRRAAIS